MKLISKLIPLKYYSKNDGIHIRTVRDKYIVPKGKGAYLTSCDISYLVNDIPEFKTDDIPKFKIDNTIKEWASEGIASQSSSYVESQYPASNTLKDDNTFCHTECETGAWWQVKLNENIIIERILIKNRNDYCQEILQNFDICIMDKCDQIVKTIHENDSKNVYDINDIGCFGSILKIKLCGCNYLHLSNVKVFGTKISLNNEIKEWASEGIASQSSNYEGGSYPASNTLIDNNTFGCTGYETGAWWQVKLNENIKIERILIKNRGDCCQERLQNFDICIIDKCNQIVKIIHENDSKKVYDINDIGCCGSIVKIKLCGCDYLHLSNVKVFGTKISLNDEIKEWAYEGIASQSSNYRESPYPASNTLKDDNTFGCTECETGAWWQVKLNENIKIERILIKNRNDGCQERLQNFDICIMDKCNQIVKIIHENDSKKVYDINDIGCCGSIVKIKLCGCNYLHLSNVKVFGTKISLNNEIILNEISAEIFIKQGKTKFTPLRLDYNRYKKSQHKYLYLGLPLNEYDEVALITTNTSLSCSFSLCVVIVEIDT